MAVKFIRRFHLRSENLARPTLRLFKGRQSKSYRRKEENVKRLIMSQNRKYEIIRNRKKKGV